LSFSDFAAAARAMPEAEQLFVGLLLLIGFGAKLGLLPFYEWFPGAYGAGSGATGALLSGVVLNAAFFGLSRALTEWLPVNHALPVSIPGIFIVAIGVLSAILSALYGFQREDWRELLSLSSAENASIAVCLLGAALMFRQDGLIDLAGLAWTVALLHLAGHAVAKGAMFLAADGVYRVVGNYMLVQRGILARSSWIFGLGALFAAMSLAAMPPQAGFVSEWYLFQVFFPGLPPQQFGEPDDGGSGRRGIGTYGGDRLCNLHQTICHRAPRARGAKHGANANCDLGRSWRAGIARPCVGSRDADLADPTRTALSYP
jgi:hydrogenase-4 component B